MSEEEILHIIKTRLRIDVKRKHNGFEYQPFVQLLLDGQVISEAMLPILRND